jgi:hypothetical protein
MSDKAARMRGAEFHAPGPYFGPTQRSFSSPFSFSFARGGAMNTANLQLEGLYMAVASLVELLKEKGILDAAEVDVALARAERAAYDGKETDLSPANLEAIGFPIRLLRLANSASPAGHPLPFQELTRRVGEARDRRSTLSEEEILKLATILEHERDA